MPRPSKCRMIDALPDVTFFKPRGIPMRQLKSAYITLEGFEAIRLVDYEGCSQAEAAQRMHISRQTLGRILSQARGTLAKTIVTGMALHIHGGHYSVAQNSSATCGMSPEQTQSGAPNQNTKEVNKMDKIAISSEGPTLDDPLDPRFGRAAGFIIVNPQTLGFSYVDNGAAQAQAQGAGIQAAETVANAGAQAVLTGYVGPKAFQALEAAGLQIAQNLENLTVRQAIERFQQGQVTWAETPNRRGHGR